MGKLEETLVLCASGEASELFSHLPCRLELCARMVKRPQPPQHREKLRRLRNLLAQLVCPGVNPLHLPGPITPESYQRRAKGCLQGQLLLQPLPGGRQAVESGNPLREVGNRFAVG